MRDTKVTVRYETRQSLGGFIFATTISGETTDKFYDFIRDYGDVCIFSKNDDLALIIDQYFGSSDLIGRNKTNLETLNVLSVSQEIPDNITIKEIASNRLSLQSNNPLTAFFLSKIADHASENFLKFVKAFEYTIRNPNEEKVYT
ncbi:hypothetical protein VB618_18250 [Microvirga sp. CF3062]|uniref:hypothetical protein n=1 Tax=Microvirga sp. CF3062 TaxID=3110182 RepID=UPI002E7A2069|nr:hypothetical protein [Microvirga sp. CF3062]MEE1658144.1 hypothetical protein [Microvirga sp. CF3062]